LAKLFSPNQRRASGLSVSESPDTLVQPHRQPETLALFGLTRKSFQALGLPHAEPRSRGEDEEPEEISPQRHQDARPGRRDATEEGIHPQISQIFADENPWRSEIFR